MRFSQHHRTIRCASLVPSSYPCSVPFLYPSTAMAMRRPLGSGGAEDGAGLPPLEQGLTPVNFSNQRNHFLWDRGCLRVA